MTAEPDADGTVNKAGEPLDLRPLRERTSTDGAAKGDDPLDPRPLRERTSTVFDAAVEERLTEIETALLRAAEADTALVTEAAQHVIAAGGKRFRPLLVVLAASLGPRQDPAAVVKAATVVELTHVASLYHDDVMDEAVLRRGAPSANDRWGNTVAILVGDYLFARASDLVAQLGPDYVRVQAQTFARLVQGQIGRASCRERVSCCV